MFARACDSQRPRFESRSVKVGPSVDFSCHSLYRKWVPRWASGSKCVYESQQPRFESPSVKVGSMLHTAVRIGNWGLGGQVV